MHRAKDSWIINGLAGVMALSGPTALGQEVPWDVFSDTVSTSVCDVVNAANAELVVLSGTGQLVLVTGVDTILEDSFLDIDGSVFFEGEPVGFIDFAADGDGLRTLWWMSLTGSVVMVDGFTVEPSESNSVPSDFVDVPCDACAFWDDQSICHGPDSGNGGGSLPPVPPLVSFNFCGAGSGASMAMSAVGLGFVRRRRRRI